MLDINFIRQNPEKVKKSCQVKQVNIDIDKILSLDKKRRDLLKKIEDLRHQKNLISGTGGGQVGDRSLRFKAGIIRKAKELKEKIRSLEENLKVVERDFQELMFQIPNLPLDNVPIGRDESDNIVIKKVGKIPKFDFQPKDHLEIGENLGILDVKRAAKVAGARFSFLKNEAVLLEFALVRFAFDKLLKKGFHPVLPPVMMRSKMLRGMGYIEQTDKEESYYLPKDDLFLAGTAEQPIGAMHAGEIFKEKDLPKRYVGFSTCFRREAGSYGKDTRGIFRVHQFDKVEMFSFCKPEDSKEEHKFLLSIEEELMQSLEIPYQVINICTGDLGLPAASKYDIEAWLPSQNRYRETHSTSNCTDFQARRLGIKYRTSDTASEFVHTLNGTALAIGRILIAILENYQRKDGKIDMPKVLQKYLSFKTIPKK